MADLIIKPANPAPLGLVAFGLTTVVLSSINAGLVPKDAVTVVVPLAFAFGGLGQIIAGAMEFRNGNTFGTVAFSSFGLFWWWYAFLQWTIGAGWLKAGPGLGTGLGVALFMWGVFTLYMWVSTFRSNLGLFLVFLTLWLTFFLLAGGEMGAGTTAIGGYMGLASGLLAMYVSFAEVTNATFNRVVIPLGRQILGPEPTPAPSPRVQAE
ncbi:MAG: acetate uptake transporter [Rudaea sp.]